MNAATDRLIPQERPRISTESSSPSLLPFPSFPPSRTGIEKRFFSFFPLFFRRPTEVAISSRRYGDSAARQFQSTTFLPSLPYTGSSPRRPLLHSLFPATADLRDPYPDPDEKHLLPSFFLSPCPPSEAESSAGSFALFPPFSLNGPLFPTTCHRPHWQPPLSVPSSPLGRLPTGSGNLSPFFSFPFSPRQEWKGTLPPFTAPAHGPNPPPSPPPSFPTKPANEWTGSPLPFLCWESEALVRSEGCPPKRLPSPFFAGTQWPPPLSFFFPGAGDYFSQAEFSLTWRRK